MKLLKRVQDFAAFTKNEQKIFLFLSVVFIAGVSIKAYRTYFVPQPVRQFDYSALDKEFEERSKHLTSITQYDGPKDTTATTNAPNAKKKINLNTATKAQLVSLPGIGESIAEQILIFRDEHGLFSSVEQLRKIKGIGAKKFEKLRPYVSIQ
ncbi:MAG: helix-hairpin-helix domain-containing protein [Bacteroidota bacterium]